MIPRQSAQQPNRAARANTFLEKNKLVEEAFHDIFALWVDALENLKNMYVSMYVCMYVGR